MAAAKWHGRNARTARCARANREFPGRRGDFRGDGPAQCRRRRHSTLNEIRWLILHGVLHLLGYDHERDSGEMIALELALREQLGGGGQAAGEKQVKVKMQKAKVKAEVV